MLPFLIKFSFSECINIYTWALNILLLDCQKFLRGNVRCSRWQHNSMKCNVNGLVSWLSQFSLIREHYRCNKGKNEIVYVKVLVFILGRNVLYRYMKSLPNTKTVAPTEEWEGILRKWHSIFAGRAGNRQAKWKL